MCSHSGATRHFPQPARQVSLATLYVVGEYKAKAVQAMLQISSTCKLAATQTGVTAPSLTRLFCEQNASAAPHSAGNDGSLRRFLRMEHRSGRRTVAEMEHDAGCVHARTAGCGHPSAIGVSLPKWLGLEQLRTDLPVGDVVGGAPWAVVRSAPGSASINAHANSCAVLANEKQS